MLDSFSAGDVLKIYYFTTINRYRRMFTFVGLCTSKKKFSFTLQNYYGKEFIIHNFCFFSPNILLLKKLLSYNFSSRLSKLYYFKKLRLKSKTDNFNLNLSTTSLDPTFYIYQSKYLKTKEKKRLRNKFRV